VFEFDVRLLLIHFLFGGQRALGHVRIVNCLIVRPKWACLFLRPIRPLSVEMIVVVNRFSAQVAHRCTTLARHLVAAVTLYKGLLAPPALANQSFGHFVLNVGTLPHLSIFFYFLASQRNVGNLFAQAATLLAAIRILTMKDLVLFRSRVHDCGELAKWATDQTVDVGLKTTKKGKCHEQLVRLIDSVR
jgi:hypothetical protein